MEKKETTKREGTVYEIGYLIVPTVSPDHLTKEVETIKAVLAQNGASVISEDAPKLRNIYYKMLKVVGPIRHKFDTAHFGWIKFEAKADAAQAIDKALKGNEKVLRFLMIKTVAENTLYGARILGEKLEGASDKPADAAAPKAAAPVKPASQEELDKSIDKLVIE